jgi:hypothetical protein
LPRRRLFLTIAIAAAVGSPAAAEAATVYVSATAKGPGEGSRADPLASLAAAERASRRGDRIVVLPAPRRAEPLDGGISLKPGQRLVGAGPSVRRGGLRRVPAVTNTSGGRNSGDAVVLADDTTVRNLVIAGTHRGGVYGRNVSGVRVVGNDVSAHNTSCAEGFHIFPFVAPTNVPGVGIPIADGLVNGWAGIMVDADRGAGEVEIVGNRVHDAECGDGIDVRLSGNARRTARIDRNVVIGLRQGPDFESVLAIGLQTDERSRLVASLDRNRQSALGNPGDIGIGPEGADSEGLFFNLGGPSHMRVLVTRNTYTNPDNLGGFSANGMEMVSMGDGSRGSVVIRDSSFSGSPGDVMEEGALGTNARLRLKLVRVVARDSVGFGSGGLLPFNNGDCMLAGSLGAGNLVELIVRRSRFTDCAGNGLGLGANVTNGTGSGGVVIADVTDSVISGNRGANLGVRNFTELDRFLLRVESTDLRGARGTMADVTFEDIGGVGDEVIDLGGGALGSEGGNCIGGTLLGGETIGFDVSAQANWWESAAGPGPAAIVAAGGSFDVEAPLSAAPPSCR